MFLSLIDPIALRLFGLEIHWYAVLIVGGACLGAFIADREAKRQNWDNEIVTDFIIYALPLAIIGARLYYVLFQLPYYLAHPLEIFMIWQGGLAIYGGLLAGFAFQYWFCNHYGFSQWKFLDILAPSIALGQAIGRWGNFVNQEAYGTVVEKSFLTKTLHLPNFIVENMKIEGVYHHPTFLYESLWCFLIFITLMILRRKTHFFKVGQVFLAYVFLYSLERMFVEGLRTDSLMFLGMIRVSQLLSVALLLVAAFFFIQRGKNSKIPFYAPDREKVFPKSIQQLAYEKEMKNMEK